MNNRNSLSNDARRARRTYRVICWLVILLAVTGFVYHYRDSANARDITVKIDKKLAGTTDISPTPDNSARLETAWKNIINDRQGLVDIAIYNDETGEISHYSNTTSTFNTASIIKLPILEALLLQDQDKGQSLTTDQLAEAALMIENSDNDSATDLWEKVGGKPAMDNFFARIGTKATVTEPDDYWGLTETTALDQLKVLNIFAYPGKILTKNSAMAAVNLLDQVEPDQEWGVSGGIPSGVSVELKNGWLPDADTSDVYADTNDWTINSIGHINGHDINYTIAVLTEGNPTEQYGIDTIEHLSAATWNSLTN